MKLTCPQCQTALEVDELPETVTCPACLSAGEAAEFCPVEEAKPHASFAESRPAPIPPRKREVEYRVDPFVASIGSRSSADEAAAQLQSTIKFRAAEGWEYVRLESVETHVAGENGCFGFGSTPSRVASFTMIVYRR